MGDLGPPPSLGSPAIWLSPAVLRDCSGTAFQTPSRDAKRRFATKSPVAAMARGVSGALWTEADEAASCVGSQSKAYACIRA